MTDNLTNALGHIDLRKVWWRDTQPIPYPEPVPIDWDRIRNQMASVVSKGYMHLTWENISLSPAMTRQEAHFWLIYMLNSNLLHEEISFDPTLYHGDIKIEDVRAAVGYTTYFIDSILIPLHVLFDIQDYLPLVLTFSAQYYAMSWAKFWLPYVTNEELAVMRDIVRPELKTVIQHQQISWDNLPSIVYWGMNCGLGDELQQLVNQMDDGIFADRHGRMKLIKSSRLPDIILSLPNADAVVYEMKRTKLALSELYQVRWWIAHTGTDHLDFVRDSIMLEKGKMRARQKMKVLGAIETVEVAGYMFELMSQNIGGAYASQWLQAHLALTAEALIPFAKRQAKQGELARTHLKMMIREGHDALILQFADEKLQDQLIDRTVTVDVPLFDENTTPLWLDQGIKQIKANKGIKSPRWVKPAMLPPVVVDGKQLTDKQVGGLLRALKGYHEAGSHEFLSEIGRYADQHLLDNFVWNLMEQWQRNGERKPEVWALFAVPRLGTDKLLPKLVPLLKDMVSRKANKRNVRAIVRATLSELAVNASDTAYMQLEAMRDTLHARRMTAQLTQAINTLARNRNLSVDDLKDRAAPDCGLDENGSRIFDYGSRQFTVVIDNNLVPMIRDNKGKIRKNLPKPGKNDNITLAEPAHESWKFIKKQVRQTIKTQTPRLEQSMIYERRWSYIDFEMLFLKHPIMRHFAKQIIWGSFVDKSLVCSFRMGEDGRFLDCYDQQITVNQNGIIGIVHPIYLDQGSVQRWQDVLLDFEIIQLFRQMNRQVFHLDANMLKDEQIDVRQFSDQQMHVLGVRSTMFKAGYQEYPRYGEYGKTFRQYDITALIRLQSVNHQASHFEAAQQISSLKFAVGKIPERYGERYETINAKDIPPLVLSEAIYDLKVTFG